MPFTEHENTAGFNLDGLNTADHPQSQQDKERYNRLYMMKIFSADHSTGVKPGILITGP